MIEGKGCATAQPCPLASSGSSDLKQPSKIALLALEENEPLAANAARRRYGRQAAARTRGTGWQRRQVGKPPLRTGKGPRKADRHSSGLEVQSLWWTAGRNNAQAQTSTKSTLFRALSVFLSLSSQQKLSR